jgi:hypothetical protein
MFTRDQAALVKGMLARGDKQHDIAAYFGENAGRVIDVKFGEKYADVTAAPAERLRPPYRAPAQMLIDATADFADQIKLLDELILTTPEGSPSVVLELSPDLNRHVLESRNNNNRDVRPAKIKLFVRDLLEAHWMLTGDTVKFGTNGELLDGQNRLRASLIAQVPIRTHVVFGVDPKAFAVLDSGAGRTSGDTFKVMGVANHSIAGQATRWLMIFEGSKIDRGVSIPNADLFDHYVKHINKDLLQSCIAAAKKTTRTLPSGSLSAMLYLFHKKDRDTARIFAHDLEKNLRAARYLIAKIEHLREQTGSRVKETIITALTILTWNAYRSGTKITNKTQLKWTDDQPHPTVD